MNTASLRKRNNRSGFYLPLNILKSPLNCYTLNLQKNIIATSVIFFNSFRFTCVYEDAFIYSYYNLRILHQRLREVL